MSPSPPAAGPAEIIRASQKDSHFIKTLQLNLNEALVQIMGQRVGQKWGDSLAYLPTALYYVFTNLAGSQTLGEEYAGILQVKQPPVQLPSKKAVSMMIVLRTVGQPLLEYLMKVLDGELLNRMSLEDSGNAGRTLDKLTGESLDSLEEEPSSWLATAQETLRVLRHYLPFLTQLHLALFYLNGRFYSFSKRLTGIQYVLVRRWYANIDAGSKRHLKYLMWMSIINSMLTAVNDSVSFIQSKKKDRQMPEEPEPKYIYSTGKWSASPNNQANVTNHEVAVKDSSEVVKMDEGLRKCSLCLEDRRDSSVTPCGHLFCWGCIIDWLRTKEECPVCREIFQPSRVVPLRNYT